MKKQPNQSSLTRKELAANRKEMQIQVGRRAKNFKGTAKMLFGWLGKYKASLIIALLFAAISSTLVILGPKVLNKMMSVVLLGNYLTSDIMKYGFTILGIYICAIILIDYTYGIMLYYWKGD